MAKKEQTTVKNAVIYARFSSHRQKDESIEQQVTECKEYAAREGLNIIDVYADKAVTGKRETRASYQRMMRDAEKGKFQIVIAYKSNRIARNMLNALLLESKLEQYAIRILYVKEEFGNTAAGRFALRTMMNVNQFYSENMAEDIVRGMRDNAMNCKVNSGVLPLGYCKGSDGKFAVKLDESAIVQEIYQKFLANMSFVDIANELNARGIKTRTSSLWNKNSFASILTNERYIGVYLWSDIRVEDGMPAIITKEMFYSVQDKLKTKSNPHGRHREAGDYLLTGKLYCGKCGALMVGMSGTSESGTKHYYYACQTQRTEKMCEKRAVRRDYIEEEVILHIRDYILQDEIIDWMVDSCMEYQRSTFENQEIIASTEQLSHVTAEIKNIVDAVAQGVITRSTKDRLLELEAEEDRLKRDIAFLTSSLKPYSEEKVRYYFFLFRDGDFNSQAFRKRLVNQFVDAIYLYDDELRIVFSGPGDCKPIPFSIIGDVEKQASSSVRTSSLLAHQTVQIRTISSL